MQRIIAGEYKGRLLSNIPGNSTRPTQARVRKSMLQIIEPLEGKKVLDLFSGSGILGIETLSRGASKLISVENNKKVFRLLSQNISNICGDHSKFELLCMDAFYYLKKTKEKFDIVISDPPYGKYDYMDVFNLASRILKKNGIFCMEMKKQYIDSDIFEIRTYGATQIILWRKDD